MNEIHIQETLQQKVTEYYAIEIKMHYS